MSAQLLRRWARMVVASNGMVRVGLVAVLLLTGGFASGQWAGRDTSNVILQPPMDTSPKPWTFERTADGQPKVFHGRWDITNAGNGWLHNPQVGATGPNAREMKPVHPSANVFC